MIPTMSAYSASRSTTCPATDMYHRVARNIDVLNIHQLDGAARRAGRGMRPQRGVVDGMLRSSDGMAGRMHPGWASARSRSVGRAGRMFPGWDSVHSKDVATFVGAIVAAANAAPAEGSLGPRSHDGSNRTDGDGH